MKRVQLDYLAPARGPLWPGLLVLALSLAIAGTLFMRYRHTQEQLALLQTSGKLISPERRPQVSMSKERMDAEVKSAESVVRELALPWASLVQAIEQASTRQVALLQLQPDAEKRIVKLTAEARSREAMFDYMRRLGAANGLADVHIVSHQVQREDPQHPIQFSVQASFRSPR
jgi:Tfp pilus assembly protein PilN